MYYHFYRPGDLTPGSSNQSARADIPAGWGQSENQLLCPQKMTPGSWPPSTQACQSQKILHELVGSQLTTSQIQNDLLPKPIKTSYPYTKYKTVLVNIYKQIDSELYLLQ